MNGHIIGSLSLVALLLLGGCFPGEPQTRSFEDTGSICIGVSSPWESGGDPLLAGETASVSVLFAECLSSSCSANLDGSCTVSQYESGATVSSSGSYDDTSGVDGVCTMDCMSFQAECGEITIPDREFAIIHGDAHFYLEPGVERRCYSMDEAQAPRAITHTFENEGMVCLGTDHAFSSPQDRLEADEPFQVLVAAGGCMSSSCSQDLEAQCEVAVDGQDVTITSSASYGDTSHLSDGCTDDCGTLQAICGEITLPEGTYTVTHGAETFELTIPSDDAGCQ